MEARDKCLEEGGYLVEIDSNEETAAITAAIISQGWMSQRKEFWIGLSDLETVGQWRWDHSRKLIGNGIYSNWGSGEPNLQGTERCAHINTMYAWNNLPCDWKKIGQSSWHALCESQGQCSVTAAWATPSPWSI